LPFTALPLYPALSGINWSLIEAARTLGASPARAFVSIVLPLTRRPSLAAFLVAAVLTMGTYVPPLVLGRPQSWPLSVLIGSTALAGHDLPGAAALSLFLLLATFVLAAATAWLARSRVKT